MHAFDVLGDPVRRRMSQQSLNRNGNALRNNLALFHIGFHGRHPLIRPAWNLIFWVPVCSAFAAQKQWNQFYDTAFHLRYLKPIGVLTMTDYDKKPDFNVSNTSDSSSATIALIVAAIVLVVGAFIFFGSTSTTTPDGQQLTQNNITPAPITEPAAPIPAEPPAAEPVTPPAPAPLTPPATTPRPATTMSRLCWSSCERRKAGRRLRLARVRQSRLAPARLRIRRSSTSIEGVPRWPISN